MSWGVGMVGPCVGSEVVDFSVGVDYGAFAFFAGLGVAVFHADDAGVAFGVDVFEYVFVVYFAGGGLFAAGVVADLEVGDLVVGFVDVGDEVAFGDLLVVEVV